MVSVEMQESCRSWLEDVEAEMQRLQRVPTSSRVRDFDRLSALVLAQSYLSLLVELSDELRRTELVPVLKGGGR